MLRIFPLLTMLIASVAVLSCANDNTVATGQLIVEFDPTVDFSQIETFSIVTQEVAPPDAPEPSDDEVVFNNQINELIIEAMTSSPVCMEYIPREEAADRAPDVWAANGVARTTGEGTVWQCQGGWWWGWYGWWWDPCAWLVPVPVEFDVGNLFVPVGPAPEEGVDTEMIFAGLAQSVATGQDVETKVAQAIQAIFAQWPVQRTCP